MFPAADYKGHWNSCQSAAIILLKTLAKKIVLLKKAKQSSPLDAAANVSDAFGPISIDIWRVQRVCRMLALCLPTAGRTPRMQVACASRPATIRAIELNPRIDREWSKLITWQSALAAMAFQKLGGVTQAAHDNVAVRLFHLSSVCGG